MIGYPAAAIRLFCERMGVSKSENNIDMSVLEDCVRDTLGNAHTHYTCTLYMHTTRAHTHYTCTLYMHITCAHTFKDRQTHAQIDKFTYTHSNIHT